MVAILDAPAKSHWALGSALSRTRTSMNQHTPTWSFACWGYRWRGDRATMACVASTSKSGVNATLSVGTSAIAGPRVLHDRRDEQVKEGGEEILGVGIDSGCLHEPI